MSYYWIERAMASSMGSVSVKALGQHLFCATMSWKNGHRGRERKKSGAMTRSVEEALESLDNALHEEVREELDHRAAEKFSTKKKL